MIPLAFGTAWRGRAPEPKDRLKRILVVRADRLGDFVLSTSCIEPLQQQFPETHFAFLVAEPFAELLTKSSKFEVWPLGKQALEYWVNRVKAFRSEAVVFLNPHPLLEQACLEAAVPVRIGTSREGGKRLSYWRPYTWKKQGLQHEAVYNFDLLAPLGLQQPESLVPASFEHTVFGDALPERPMLVHLASFGDKPTVPPEFFAGLVEALNKQYGWLPVIVGSEADDPAIAQFLEALTPTLREQCISYAGDTTLAELAGMCRQASCMISRDSGPAHLAAATGCPTLSLFVQQRRLMSPKRWHPLGPKSAVYTEPVIPIPFESPKGEARRVCRKFRVDAAIRCLESVL